MRSENKLTDIVRRADDLPDVLVLLNDPRRLHVAQLDLAVREAPHQHNVLSLTTESLTRFMVNTLLSLVLIRKLPSSR